MDERVLIININYIYVIRKKYARFFVRLQEKVYFCTQRRSNHGEKS